LTKFKSFLKILKDSFSDFTLLIHPLDIKHVECLSFVEYKDHASLSNQDKLFVTKEKKEERKGKRKLKEARLVIVSRMI